MYRRDAQLEQTTRFAPGQEDAARAFLRQPSAHRRYWMIGNRKTKWMLIFGPITSLLAAWFLDWMGELDGVGWFLVSIVTFLVVGIPLLFLFREGLFVLDPERQIVRYRKRDVHFSQLGLVHVGTRKAETLIGATERRILDHLVLRTGPEEFFLYDDVSEKLMAQIADRLNAMLAEYHEREAVRAWLQRREAVMGQAAGGKRGVS